MTPATSPQADGKSVVNGKADVRCIKTSTRAGPADLGSAGWILDCHDYWVPNAAIAHLTETTANELGEHGVRVNAVCPGAIANSIFGHAAGLDSEEAQRTVDFMTTLLRDAAPILRVGWPADIAETVLRLASEASASVTGEAIAVDGGLLTGLAAPQRSDGKGGEVLELIRHSASQ
jgi:NAD(P)-dependent dehydrogenase (short-subunit alcohol dehydrogenase family)